MRRCLGNKWPNKKPDFVRLLSANIEIPTNIVFQPIAFAVVVIKARCSKGFVDLSRALAHYYETKDCDVKILKYSTLFPDKSTMSLLQTFATKTSTVWMASKTTRGGALCDLVIVMHAGNRLLCASKLQYERLEKKIFFERQVEESKERSKGKVRWKSAFQPRSWQSFVFGEHLGNAAASYVFLSQTRTKNIFFLGSAFVTQS